MALPVKTFDEIVSQQQSAMLAAASPVILDFTAGSIFLAIVQSNAGNFLWLQALTTALLAVTRLSTSIGNDVDTFINDFGFYRYQGNASSGNVTFSRFTPTVLASIPVGTIVSVSTVNNLTFIVTADTENPNYDVTTNSYLMQISTANISVPVTCQVVGAIGNVSVGAINVINTFLFGVDTVSNSQEFTNGQNVWSDAQTRSEFVLYIQSLSRATEASIDFAVSQVPGVTRFATVENEDPNGDEHLGFFFVVVDDGTGSPPPQLLTNVAAAVEDYRGFTIAYDVIAPTTIDADIFMDLTLIPNPTNSNPTIISNVTVALQNYIAALQLNPILPYTRLAEIIYDADPNILNVTALTLNGSTADLNPLQDELTLAILSGDITVNIVV